jgi:hypothetical protein
MIIAFSPDTLERQVRQSTILKIYLPGLLPEACFGVFITVTNMVTGRFAFQVIR